MDSLFGGVLLENPNWLLSYENKLNGINVYNATTSYRMIMKGMKL